MMKYENAVKGRLLQTHQACESLKGLTNSVLKFDYRILNLLQRQDVFGDVMGVGELEY